MFCDFCTCSACQTGCGSIMSYDGDKEPTITVSQSQPKHTQCIDGRWICDICYHYECCVDAGSNPCKGLCEEYKCDHRPELVNGEWTFWTYHLQLNS
jgi:hypothetical protein